MVSVRVVVAEPFVLVTVHSHTLSFLQEAKLIARAATAKKVIFFMIWYLNLKQSKVFFL